MTESGKHLPSAVANWSDSYQDNLQKVIDITQAYFENTTKAQTELARLIQDRMTTANNNVLDSIQEITNAPTAYVPKDDKAQKPLEPGKVTV